MTDPVSANSPENENPLGERLNSTEGPHSCFSQSGSHNDQRKARRERKELHRVPLLNNEHSTYVGTTIAMVEVELVHQALKKNVDLFMWTTSDMLGVSPNIITHKSPCTRSVPGCAEEEKSR